MNFILLSSVLYIVVEAVICLNQLTWKRNPVEFWKYKDEIRCKLRVSDFALEKRAEKARNRCFTLEMRNPLFLVCVFVSIGFVMFCSVLSSHTASVDVIMGILFDECIDQWLACP